MCFLLCYYPFVCLGAGTIHPTPTFYIETDNPNATIGKKDYVSGKLTIVSSDKKECMTDALLGIRGRGNSTWGMAKKPYRIKFDSKTRLLNLNAKAKSWVLLANYADKTLMRNAVAFEVSSFWEWSLRLLSALWMWCSTESSWAITWFPIRWKWRKAVYR